MEPILNDLHTTTEQLTFHEPTLPIISTLTGQPITPTTMANPDYWTNHARHTVQLAQATQTMTDHGITTYLEIGPAGTLTPHLPHRRTLPPTAPTNPNLHTLTTTLAHLHTHGHTPNWTTYYNHPNPHHTPLPTYPFQHHTYWLNNQPHSTTSDTASASAAPVDSHFWEVVERKDLDALSRTLGVAD